MDELDSFIYFHHLDKVAYFVPPESMTDSNRASFGVSTPLGRPNPIFTWNGSGARSVDFNIPLHTDMMKILRPGDIIDSVEEMKNTIETVCLPSYSQAQKMINPPVVTVNIKKQLTITGVVNGSVSKTYSGAWRNGKQLMCTIAFTVSEYEPYDAVTAALLGSYRGIPMALDRRLGRRA
jgi:hypothetical protein